MQNSLYIQQRKSMILEYQSHLPFYQHLPLRLRFLLISNQVGGQIVLTPGITGVYLLLSVELIHLMYISLIRNPFDFRYMEGKKDSSLSVGVIGT